VPADLIHLVRHAEVHNPDGILYGRIPGFRLSELGLRMAEVSAASLAGHPVRRLVASPLQRAQESARPWADRFQLPIATDDRLIEPTNWFEGKKFTVKLAMRRPSWALRLANPMRPSWGEPYQFVLARMLAAIDDAHAAVDGGEVVLVSHQMPIVMVQRHVAGLRSMHHPGKRRCSLSSITTLAMRDGKLVEVGYAEPAKDLLAGAIDSGAV
jgi:broad specificity phosphatase PhoE